MKPLTALYATVTFLSALLLFLLEPIAARELLPLFGGSAAVWTTCLVFFQCALLAGYFYAHAAVSQLASRTQAFMHIGLIASAALSLALRIRPGPEAAGRYPVFAILWLLTATIGLPFLALAATSPLLQAWYARAADGERPPWWLFALSNAGSLLALLLYPIVIEPRLGLHRQVAVWAGGFCVFAVLCAGLAWHSSRAFTPGPIRYVPTAPSDGHKLQLLWILLPGCGSMLLCAVTNHLGENVAAIPLLWILPLAAYLLSFVVAFSSPRAWPRFVSLRMLALTLAIFAYLLYNSRSALPLQISLPVYTLALFFGCLFCHSELYRLRPAGSEVTNFYLLISLGSAIGAILVGVVAPNVFDANYDLACSAILLAAAALAATWRAGAAARLAWTASLFGLVYIAHVQANALSEDALVQVRSFYGSLRVTQTHPPFAETMRTLFHGRIQHGTQLFGDGLRTRPSSYYPPASGVALALDLCCEGRTKRVGIVGLGTGTVAAYGNAGDDFTFFEIDPLVGRLARSLFTYLHDSPATVHVIFGDARLSLAADTQAALYDVLVLDAFSGDAIPMHLLTFEAIALYGRHLKPGGVMAIHISSQYADLAPELKLLADHAGLHAVAVHSDSDEARGFFAADWVLLSSDRNFFLRPEIANAARPLRELPGLRLWSDDYSSLLPLLKWSAATAPSTKP